MREALRLTFAVAPQGAMLATGLITAGVGVVYLVPVEAFPTSTTYRIMAAVASETAWGIGLLIVGVLMLAAWWFWCQAEKSRNATGEPPVRASASYRFVLMVFPIGAGLWTVIAGSFFLANRAATGWFTYGIVGLGFSVFVAIRTWQLGKADAALRRD